MAGERFDDLNEALRKLQDARPSRRERIRERLLLCVAYAILGFVFGAVLMAIIRSVPR